MLKLTLMVMTYFQKVAELKHVTKTAEALQVAQPTVSRVINSIEKDFTVPVVCATLRGYFISDSLAP